MIPDLAIQAVDLEHDRLATMMPARVSVCDRLRRHVGVSLDDNFDSLPKIAKNPTHYSNSLISTQYRAFLRESVSKLYFNFLVLSINIVLINIVNLFITNQPRPSSGWPLFPFGQGRNRHVTSIVAVMLAVSESPRPM